MDIRTDEGAAKLNAAYEAGYAEAWNGTLHLPALDTDSVYAAAYRAGFDSGREALAEYHAHAAGELRSAWH